MRVNLVTNRVLLCLIIALGFGGFFGCAADSSSGNATSTSPLLSNGKDDDKDGEVDEADEAKGEKDDGDKDDGDKDDDDKDDEQGADKVSCVADTDCDADEVCTNGSCTGVDDVCASDAECKQGEVCRNGNCEDPI